MDRKPLIGMMLGWKVEPALMRACAVAAAYHGADFYYFRASDIGEHTIVGMKLEHDEWVRGEFRYPDAVYDNTRRRGIARFEAAYRKLDGIPMGHTIAGRSMTKIKVYKLVERDPQLAQSLIPYKAVRESDARDVIDFIERHERVIFKTNGGYLGRNALTAEFVADGVELYDQQYKHRFSQEDLPRLIHMLAAKKYFVQKLIRSVTPQGHPFHVRLHLSKNGAGRWIVAFHSIGLSLTPHVKVTNTDLTYRGTSTWADFLANQFGEKENGPLHTRIDGYGLRMAEHLEKAAGGGFHEIGLDIGIDAERRFWLFEAGLGLPRTSYYQLQLALPAMAYTLRLLRQHLGEPGNSGEPET